MEWNKDRILSHMKCPFVIYFLYYDEFKIDMRIKKCMGEI